MDQVRQFIRQNKFGLALAVFFYGIFLYYTFSGNRICDCESTENYKPTASSRGTVTRFYHK
ncbi:hypothetical protein ABGT15_11035 [Flavobacterium enshiense]|uniref:hypothetical protein n=1 Tax=Flavobacterium enshiense TaxID=1341165 RepID=UPI00345E0314